MLILWNFISSGCAMLVLTSRLEWEKLVIGRILTYKNKRSDRTNNKERERDRGEGKERLPPPQKRRREQINFDMLYKRFTRM